MKKTHHCSLDVCVLGRKWLWRGICDKTGVCRHHFLLPQLCNASPQEPQTSLIPNTSPAPYVSCRYSISHQITIRESIRKMPCEVHAVSTHKALQRPLMLGTEIKLWMSQPANIFPRSNGKVLEERSSYQFTSLSQQSTFRCWLTTNANRIMAIIDHQQIHSKCGWKKTECSVLCFRNKNACTLTRHDQWYIN